MEGETSTFDDWLGEAKILSNGLELTNSLNIVAMYTAMTLGAHFWFVKIMGKRWSYIAGEKRECPSNLELERIELVGETGMVVESWGSMGEEEKKKLLSLLNQLISRRLSWGEMNKGTGQCKPPQKD